MWQEIIELEDNIEKVEISSVPGHTFEIAMEETY